MTLSIIVAMSQNRVIGRDNQLPWHLSEDLKRFKQITMGHPVIMGRKTYESIGKPLPGRENIVLTRDKNFHAEGVRICFDVGAIHELPLPHPEIFVIGGAEIFRLVLPQVNKIYLTLIEDEFEGDVFFPDIDFHKEFKMIEETKTRFSEKDQLPYHFITYQR